VRAVQEMRMWNVTNTKGEGRDLLDKISEREWASWGGGGEAPYIGGAGARGPSRSRFWMGRWHGGMNLDGWS
jgi:hypothetical protein